MRTLGPHTHTLTHCRDFMRVSDLRPSLGSVRLNYNSLAFQFRCKLIALFPTQLLSPLVYTDMVDSPNAERALLTPIDSLAEEDQQEQQEQPPQENEEDEVPEAQSPDNQEDPDESQEEGQEVSASPTSTSALLNKIHPLKQRWTFWYLNNKKDLDWLHRLKKVCTLTSVEEFWA